MAEPFDSKPWPELRGIATRHLARIARLAVGDGPLDARAADELREAAREAAVRCTAVLDQAGGRISGLRDSLETLGGEVQVKDSPYLTRVFALVERSRRLVEAVEAVRSAHGGARESADLERVLDALYPAYEAAVAVRATLDGGEREGADPRAAVGARGREVVIGWTGPEVDPARTLHIGSREEAERHGLAGAWDTHVAGRPPLTMIRLAPNAQEVDDADAR